MPSVKLVRSPITVLCPSRAIGRLAGVIAGSVLAFLEPRSAGSTDATSPDPSSRYPGTCLRLPPRLTGSVGRLCSVMQNQFLSPLKAVRP